MSTYGAPPATELEVTLTADQVAFYRENGFLVVDRITTDEEIDWFQRIYEDMFDPERVDGVVRPVDRSGVRDEACARTITQVFHPELDVPEILASTYVRNAKRIASALLDISTDDLTVWTHMIRKAPGAAEVPPHQDEAFWPADFDYRSVAAWMPLHDVPVDMGAMQFLPGSHRDGVRHHRHYDHPLQSLLTVDPPVADDAFVACPLPAGGCTFHDPATVHRTAVNATGRPRLALPLTVQSVPIRRATRRETPWLDEHLAAGGREQTSYVADGRVLPLPV